MPKLIFKSEYLFIIFLTVLAHFIPFERQSLAPDDYSLMNKKFNFLYNFFIYSDRPMQYFFLDLKYYFLKNNEIYYSILLIFVNIINCIVVYKFLLLFLSKNNTLFTTLIYILMFNKLEIYHNAIMIHIVIVSTLYILSTYLLLLYFSNLKKRLLYLSIILYLISIIWYEIGFFLPFIVFFIKNKNFNIYQKIKFISPFIILMFFYLLFRLSPSFGFIKLSTTHSINSNYIFGIYDLLNHYFGRYMIKNFVYGIYKFFSTNLFYFIILIFLNTLFIIFVFFKFKYENIKKNNLLFFTALFVLSVLPLIINGESGGRNLIISSISFSYLLFFIINLFSKTFKIIYLCLFLLGLIISQGNNFAQVKASSIQKDILLTLDNNIEEINKSDYLIFNVKSLMERIDYTFVNNDYNLLNTYFGAQVWEIWGIRGYMNNNKFNQNLELVISIDNPIINDDYYEVIKLISYEKKRLITKKIRLSNKNIFEIDYDRIYNYN